MSSLEGHYCWEDCDEGPHGCICGNGCQPPLTFQPDIATSTGRIAQEILRGRMTAYEKHGAESIESLSPLDIARWLPILGEEMGEVFKALTYDQDSSTLRSELLDVATVVVAWVAAIDRGAVKPRFVDNRNPACVERWPDCSSGDYHQNCCRFPKSCSAGYIEALCGAAVGVNNGEHRVPCTLRFGHAGPHVAEGIYWQ